MVTEPFWITEEAVFAIHVLQIAEHGGGDGIRDNGMLDSALNRPKNRWNYEKADLPTLAASYAFGIAKNHPFVDGNKRTAAVVCETFLRRNGMGIVVSNDEWYQVILDQAGGAISEESFAAWLRERLRRFG